MSLRYAHYCTNGRILGMLAALSVFSTKGIFLLPEMAENKFCSIFAVDIWSSLARRRNHRHCNCYGCIEWDNIECTCSKCYCFLVANPDCRINEQLNPVLNRNPNKHFVFEFHFLSLFDDKFCLEDIKCIQLIIIVNSELSVIYDSISLIREFSEKVITFRFRINRLLYCLFWYRPFSLDIWYLASCDCLTYRWLGETLNLAAMGYINTRSFLTNWYFNCSNFGLVGFWAFLPISLVYSQESLPVTLLNSSIKNYVLVRLVYFQQKRKWFTMNLLP